jgi:hypothetical protein
MAHPSALQFSSSSPGQQPSVFRRQRMGDAPCASGNRLGVECRQQEASVFPEAGPRQGLVGQGKPGQRCQEGSSHALSARMMRMPSRRFVTPRSCNLAGSGSLRML